MAFIDVSPRLQTPTYFIMSFDVSFVSPNFAEFLLDSAVDGNEILAVLEDIVEVEDTAL